MVGIRLRKLRIENFRGIKSLAINVSDTTVLIGENNAGKTSIMNAIQKCLKDLNTRRNLVFDPLDFYLDKGISEPTKPILIELTFSEDIVGQWETKVVGNLNRLGVLQVDKANLYSVILRVTCEFDPTTRDFNQDWMFLNTDGQPLSSISDSTLWAFHQEVSLFYLAALRNADRHFEARGPFWSPFLKDSKLTEKQRNDIEVKLKEVNNIVVDSHESFREVSNLLASVKDIMPLSPDDTVSIDAVPNKIYEILKKARVSLGAVSGAKIPIDRHGEGTQSLAVILLFSAFLSTYTNNEAIIALEEPEAHLHPSAVRTIWKAIESIPCQRLITTHSGDLVSQIDIHNLRRLSNNSSGVICYSTESMSLSPNEARMLSFHIQRTRGELLFANCWLLIEGETEDWVYSGASRACSIDLNKEGVSIVEISQSDVGLLAKLANSLGIPWYCVLDNDNGRKKYEKKVISNLAGADRKERLSFPYDNVEIHLLENGFDTIYSKFMPEQNLKKIKVDKSNPDYWREYYNNFPKDHKTKAAFEVGREMESQGCLVVTKIIKDTLEHVVDLARKGADNHESG